VGDKHHGSTFFPNAFYQVPGYAPGGRVKAGDALTVSGENVLKVGKRQFRKILPPA
jgi:hypothetical protein